MMPSIESRNKELALKQMMAIEKGDLDAADAIAKEQEALEESEEWVVYDIYKAMVSGVDADEQEGA